MRPCTCSSGFQWRFDALILCFCTTLFQTTHQNNSHSQLCFISLVFSPLVLYTLGHKNKNNNNYMTLHGHRIGARDWQAHLSCDRGQQGNDILVTTPVHSSPKGECGLFPEHNEDHMKRRRNRLHCLDSIFLPAALCLWAKNNNNSNLYSAIKSQLRSYY